METESLKVVEANFRGKFSFNNHPLKNGHINFEWQDQWTNSAKRQKHPDLAGSWVQELFSIWMQWENLLERVRKSPSKDLAESWVFEFMCFNSSVLIKDPDKVKTRTSWHGKIQRPWHSVRSTAWVAMLNARLNLA